MNNEIISIYITTYLMFLGDYCIIFWKICTKMIGGLDYPLMKWFITAESHFGQNDTLARDTLAGTLWPEWHFGQNDTLARDTLAGDTLAGETVWPVSLWLVTFWLVTLWPETLWPEWHFGQRHFGQSDTLASFSCFLWGTKGWKKIS